MAQKLPGAPTGEGVAVGGGSDEWWASQWRLKTRKSLRTSQGRIHPDAEGVGCTPGLGISHERRGGQGQAQQQCFTPAAVHQGQIRGALEHELSDFVAAACSGIPSSTACLRQAIEGLKLGEAIVEASRTGRTVCLEPAGDDQVNPKL